MALSTRNRVPAEITEVVKGEAAAKVSLRVGEDHLVALITRESVEELGLEESQQVTALIKATGCNIIATRYRGPGEGNLVRISIEFPGSPLLGSWVNKGQLHSQKPQT